MDVNRRIPRREYERGLEIGGMFFDVDAIKIVGTAFNEVFIEYHFYLFGLLVNATKSLRSYS